MAAPLLATTRNGIIERLERGHCVIADATGTVRWSVGEPDHVTFLRSAAQPMQAAALVLSGAVERFGLGQANVALACGSHRGEPGHVRTALATLQSAGLGPEALGCGTHPLLHEAGLRLASAGLAPTPLHNNCSGKHAGMLAASVAMGAPVETYLAPDHPVQQRILEIVSTCAGVAPETVQTGIDGCSAPNFALPMRSIARCFARIADLDSLPGELGAAMGRIRSAMIAEPWYVSGTDQFDTLLMQATPGAFVVKAGAEGLRCVALPAMGLGLAVKFESGRADTMGAVVLAILEALGAFPGGVPGSLQSFVQPAVLNHRKIVVGETRILCASVRGSTLSPA
jgi:L-asparaginase II